MNRIIAASVAALVASPALACTATLAEFNRLETGMSLAQAAAVIGCQGEVMSQSEIAGYKTVMLTWQGSGMLGANMNAMFQNGELVMKAQFGLK